MGKGQTSTEGGSGLRARLSRHYSKDDHELIRERLSDPQVREVLEKALAERDRIDKLIDDLRNGKVVTSDDLQPPLNLVAWAS